MNAFIYIEFVRTDTNLTGPLTNGLTKILVQ